MPNSLRCKIKHLHHNGTLTERECDRILKALEQEPCEDCVSREEVHNLIIPWLNDYLLDETREALETIDYKIGDLPSVTPQPKTGHWINQHVILANATIDFKVCSECRYEFSYDAETGVSDANYCPNCGAKMESEDKE